MIYRFKIEAKLPILISRHFDFSEKLEKKTFPKDFFNEIQPILGDCKYNKFYNTKKDRNFLLLWDRRGKTIFPRPSDAKYKMLISEKTLILFFASKEAYQ